MVAIKILFTPDEEVGKGTAKVDLQKLGADYGILWMEEKPAHLKMKLSVPME